MSGLGEGILVMLVYVCGVIALLGLLEGASFCWAGFVRPALVGVVDRIRRPYCRAGRLYLGGRRYL